MISDLGKYFLYRHIRIDTNQVFYIGVGTKTYHLNTFNEIYRRAFLKAGRNNLWNKIVSKSDYRIEIVLESDDYGFILLKEREFIKLYGRRDLNLGTLCNFTDGGEGNQNMPKRKCSEETKLKMSLSSIGVKKSSQHKQKLSDSKLNNPVTYWKGKKFSEEHKQKLRDAKRKK